MSYLKETIKKNNSQIDELKKQNDGLLILSSDNQQISQEIQKLTKDLSESKNQLIHYKKLNENIIKENENMKDELATSQTTINEKIEQLIN